MLLVLYGAEENELQFGKREMYNLVMDNAFQEMAQTSDLIL